MCESDDYLEIIDYFVLIDSSKKRRKIRLNISRQKELLQELLSTYNDNIPCHPDLTVLTDISQQTCLHNGFPWKIMQSGDASGLHPYCF